MKPLTSSLRRCPRSSRIRARPPSSDRADRSLMLREPPVLLRQLTDRPESREPLFLLRQRLCCERASGRESKGWPQRRPPTGRSGRRWRRRALAKRQRRSILLRCTYCFRAPAALGSSVAGLVTRGFGWRRSAGPHRRGRPLVCQRRERLRAIAFFERAGAPSHRDGALAEVAPADVHVDADRLAGA